MSDYTQEQFEQLPEFMQKDLTKVGDVYKHAGVVKLKESLNELDGKVKTYESQTNELTGKLSEFEKAQKQAIEQAKQEAYERAKKEGNVDEIEKRYQEMLEDNKKRSGETIAQYEERIKKMTDNIKSEKINAVVSDLAAKHATDAGREAFKRLVKSSLDYDPESGQMIFKDSQGSATSLDLAGFEAELSKDAALAPVLKANVATQGGGLANGGSKGSAQAKTMQRAQFDQLSPKAKMEFITKQHGTVTD